MIEESFGSEIDMKNLCWIYRQKRYYNMPGELIFATIIPIHYKIPREALIEMIRTPDADSFVALARPNRAMHACSTALTAGLLSKTTTRW